MALIFPRIAQNFIKNGYYPTDLETLNRIATAIDTTGNPVRVIDPCCGEGSALQVIAEHLSQCGSSVQSFGIDVDEERAWHAKSVLGTVAHADVHDVRITDRSFGLLFLNPPYGDLITDQVGSGDKSQGRQRHEKVFCRRTFGLLQPGGLLILIIPFYTLDEELSTLIARHFERVQVFISSEPQFKQCVLFGIKRRPAHADASTVKRLVAYSKGENQVELPERWSGEPYVVPALRGQDDFAFAVVRLDARQLEHELQAGLARSTLWPRFDLHLTPRARDIRPPLRAMSDWHLALALAAGQIRGLVTAADGRRLLIKGRTHKAKSVQTSVTVSEEGHATETKVFTDKFITVIRAIDMTPGPGLGRVLTIQ